ncbi:MAG: cell division protein FtsZ [Bacteroidales bacterium]|nr:cell division protein FtsZ [Bacteroidales bacterium]MBD5241179.1 cell division protein FtsZ [Barnesiella sp.]MBD5256543.1 cell division protein FtsZ [Bacteroides sp.]
MDEQYKNQIDSIADSFEAAENKADNKIYIKAVGVGGGGGNAVNYMYRQGIKNVAFALVNTDAQALRSSPIPTKITIGSGLGAGNKPVVAKEAAEKDLEKIETLFEDNTHMVFITATLGGGTGTGAGPVVAKIAKDKGLLTVGIITIPFYFEGDSKILKALEGVEEMRKNVDSLLIINNDRLIDIYGELDFFNALEKSDDTLATAARSISEIITTEGHMNLDFRDVETTLKDGGDAIISIGYGEGPDRLRQAIDNSLNSPLLKNSNILSAKKLLFNIYFSQNATNKFKMKEMDEMTKFVKSIDSKVDVIWGTSVDNELGDTVKIALLASGLEVDLQSNSQDDARQEIPDSPQQTPIEFDRLRSEYGNKVDDYNTNYIILTPEQMDDDNIIEILENNVAYKREKKLVESLKHTNSNNPVTMPQNSNRASSGSIEIQF